MQRADSLEKTLMLGKTEDRRRRGQRMRWLDGITDLTNRGLRELREMGKDGEAWRLQFTGGVQTCSPRGDSWVASHKRAHTLTT